MSAVAGIFHRDGRPVDPRAVDKVRAAAPEYGPDGVSARVSGAVAFCHQLLVSTREDALAAQPFVDAASGSMAVVDGRIDNRRELAAALGAAATLAAIGDAELVWRAYARWGDGCADRLLGDFAFAVHDRAAREVFCARDVVGVRPFYYALSASAFAFGTDLRHLFASGLVGRAPNEGVVAEYLADDIRTLDETLFRDVLRLPPGHWLRVGPDRAVRREYWQVDAPRELRYATDREYADHFRSLFDDAVACRLRASTPSVGVYLSGGVDSSSVVATARQVGRERAAPAIETFSLVFPGRAECDERAYLDDLARLWGVDGHLVEADAVDVDRVSSEAAAWGDVPRMPADYLADPLRLRMRALGVRVALSGAGGDHGFGGSLYHYADLLKAWRVGAVVRQFLTDARVSDVGWTPFRLVSSGLVPLLPAGVKDAVRPLALRLGWGGRRRRWIPDAFARRTNLEDRRRPVPRTVSDHATREVCEAYRLGFVVLVTEINARMSAGFGLDERHPFLDRRIVEFALAIPESQRWQGRHTKYVVRQAMGGRLPSSVRLRTNKADFSWAVVRAIERCGEVLGDLRIAGLGWVDQTMVDRMYRRLVERFDPRRDETVAFLFPLWMVTSIELWYRAVFLNELPRRPAAERRAAALV